MRQSPLFEASMVYAVTVALAFIAFLTLTLNLGSAINQTMALATLLAMPAFTFWALLAWLLAKRSVLVRLISKIAVTALIVLGGVGWVLSLISGDTVHSQAERLAAANHWLLQGSVFAVASALGAVFLHYWFPRIQARRAQSKAKSKRR